MRKAFGYALLVLPSLGLLYGSACVRSGDAATAVLWLVGMLVLVSTYFATLWAAFWLIGVGEDRGA